ncbi:protein NRT1/ PTR FAMILY 4.6-like [Cucurbita moschata]|uniref:Protein NRT1/ PTR FAMILY 4.6-like n=1 Tax=Cucurbita moschata TaxID=3662 RepID=A0A6J1G2M6_CUCMO|nr:protein NRT1/ PTR FAMILY 4.6-like [Cucurbita moschata]
MEVVKEEGDGGVWEGYVDWRRRPAVRGRHGGMRAAGFVLGVEVLENLAFLANASNLVMFLRKYMQFSPTESANHVTNFMGTAFLLALLGGFLSDAFFTTYYVFLFSSLLEFLGLVILTVEAKAATAASAAVVFVGLYLVAVGVGGIKGSLPTHGAEQFEEGTAEGRRGRSSFFNYFVFSLSCGAVVAVTLVVWMEDNLGWEWGFGISTIAILVSIPLFLAGSCFYRNKIPAGAPLTTILKVLVAATLNGRSRNKTASNAVASMTRSPSTTTPKPTKEPTHTTPPPTQTLKFLNKAIQTPPFHPSLSCTTQQLEDVKVVLKLLPIFACTIILNSCLAQLSTFSVEQASTMNTKIGSIKLPPASLPIFPILFIILLAPLYNHLIIPFARTLTRTESGITHLQRIGVGLLLSIVAMAIAALIEVKRKAIADAHPAAHPLPITFLWIGFQYLFLGSADLFTLAGLLEFFFTEAPSTMRSLATALSWASLAVGYYLSSVIVSLVNRVTAKSSHSPWLSAQDINHYDLHKFYWLMCALSALNFLHFLFWAIKYKYRSTLASK